MELLASEASNAAKLVDDGVWMLSRFARMVLKTVLALLLALAAVTAFAQKTDVITLVNGDRITCEIKELERGLLRVKTDSAGTLYIEWLDIVAVRSDKYFFVETASGILAFGSLSTTADGAGLEVEAEGRSVQVRQNSVVSIAPVEDTFWERMSGAVSFVFSIKKANDDIQLNFGTGVTYRSAIHTYGLDLSALVSSRNSEPATERYVGSFSHQAYLGSNWTSLSKAEFEQNTELDLRLRSLLLAGGSYHFVNTNRTILAAAAGLALNNESYFSADKENRTSLEVFAGMGYDFFKFNTPKADVSIRFTVFPSLTEAGRFRTTLDGKIRWEIIQDLNWVITIYSSTDNQPPESEDGDADASGTDYGIITSLEWTY
jgi:hypothetical protein